MKTEFSRSNKDNIATATILAVSLFAFAGGVFTSAPAAASRPVSVGVQKMDTIVVTAPRVARVTLNTIVVTAPRHNSHV
jgi:hypothetical protein